MKDCKDCIWLDKDTQFTQFCNYLQTAENGEAIPVGIPTIEARSVGGLCGPGGKHHELPENPLWRKDTTNQNT